MGEVRGAAHARVVRGGARVYRVDRDLILEVDRDIPVWPDDRCRPGIFR
jgi:hypothetical protein